MSDELQDAIREWMSLTRAHSPRYQTDACLDAARAALNAKLEALLKFAHGNGWNDSVLDKGDGECFMPELSNDSLLADLFNEEPADA